MRKCGEFMQTKVDFKKDLEAFIRDNPPIMDDADEKMLYELENDFSGGPQDEHTRFVQDLKKFGTVDEIPDFEDAALLQEIDKAFTEIERKIARVLDLVEELKTEDPLNPLLCPVSLFGTLNLGEKETAHTGTIAWLLNPKKNHGFGDRLFKAFFEKFVLSTEEKRQAYENVFKNNCEVNSSAEYGFNLKDKITKDSLKSENGRIDIYLELKSTDEQGYSKIWLAVIEAKVEHTETDEQLKKYDFFIDYRREEIVKELEEKDTENETQNEHKAEVTEVDKLFITKRGDKATTARNNDEWMSLNYMDIVQALWLTARKTAYKQPEGLNFLRYYFAGMLQDILGYSIDEPSSLNDDTIESFIKACLINEE